MADTRRAIPEYQLDVDMMTIEYAIYKAVETKFQLLRSWLYDIDLSSNEPLLNTVLLEEQARSEELDEIVDDLLKLLHVNHPHKHLSSGCAYNLKILEFLILFCHWFPRSALFCLKPGQIKSQPESDQTANQPILAPLPRSLVNDFEQERAINVVLRRNWLSCRYSIDGILLDGLSNSNNETDQSQVRHSSNPRSSSPEIQHYRFEPPISEAQESQWNKRIALASSRHSAAVGHLDIGQFSLNLSELTPRFLKLSVSMAQAMGNANDLWYDLAARLMYCAAVERFRLLCTTAEYSVHNTVVMPGNTYNRGWMEECFAWGSVRQPSLTDSHRLKEALASQGVDATRVNLEERLQAEDLACAIFNSAIEMQAEDEEIFEALSTLGIDSALINESKEWTKIREGWRDKFSKLYLSQAALSLDTFLRMEEESCPVQPFLQDLLQSIEGMWSCNISADVSGKPVLVQIEEGGLDGMPELEFQEFLNRVGLKSSRTKEADGSMSCQVRWLR